MISTNKKLKVTDLNPFLICVLCKGYYIDATTIVECLHSFCKTCIVKYLKRHKYCPICDVLVYKTKPLQSIRPDTRLQNVVYKLIPGLYEKEMQRRQMFFSSTPIQNSLGLTGEDKGIITESSDIILPDENISITLEYLAHSSDDINKAVYGRRYLRCKASAPVSILHKFLKNKFNLSNKHCVELVCNNEQLTQNISVMDVAYIYQWKKKTPMYLGYRILETKIKRISETEEAENSKRLKLSEESNTDNSQNSRHKPITNDAIPIGCDINSNADNNTNTGNVIPKANDTSNHINKPAPPINNQGAHSNEWKEVELKINDNGVMSATVLPPVTSQTQNSSNLLNLTTQAQSKQQYGLIPVTSETSFVPISVQQQKNVTSFTNTVPRTSAAYETKALPQVPKSEMAISSPVPAVTSTNSIPGNRALVYPMVQEPRATTHMTFTNPNIKLPSAPPPSSYMPRGSRPRAPSVPRYKTLKTGVQPWNPTVSRSKVSVGTPDPLKPQENISKIFKSRNARFMNSPSPPTTLPKLSLQDPPKPRASNSTLTKVDPRTLSPIVPVSSSTTKVDSPTYIDNSTSPSHLSVDKHNKYARPSQIKEFNPFLHPSIFYPGFLPYPPDNNPLLPNSPDFMKAMSALYQQNPAFHSSLPPSISTLFNHHLPPQSEKKMTPSSPRSSTAQPISTSRSSPMSMSNTCLSSSSSELPRSTAANHIYSLSSLPSSISVSPTTSNSHNLPASIKSYIPLNSISNSKVVSKTFSPVKSSPSSKEKSPTCVNSIFSPANMIASSSSTSSSKSYSSSRMSPITSLASFPPTVSISSAQPLSLVTTTSITTSAPSLTTNTNEERKDSNKDNTEQKATPVVISSSENTNSSSNSVTDTVSNIKSESLSTVNTPNADKNSVGDIKNTDVVLDKKEKTCDSKSEPSETPKTNILTNGENNNHLKPQSLSNEN
ncbi:polycomb group protein Psc isoform X2 [Diaphorina citri]|uniref:Polycomb group protein Psc isoform X2 n=1 Tax=Diaphorina citri TaxID=121845 RepID=A0A3Q0ITY4_DIACI|nr:polycomb group protein Psc isoform X2 [Diaphorina citri]